MRYIFFAGWQIRIDTSGSWRTRLAFWFSKWTLVLKEGKDKIFQTDFELHNDGGSISSSCWEVTWYEDYVEVILSGEEQFEEQVILYFDGTKDIQH